MKTLSSIYAAPNVGWWHFQINYVKLDKYLSVLAKNWSLNFFTHSLFSLNSLNKFYKIQINSVKIQIN